MKVSLLSLPLAVCSTTMPKLNNGHHHSRVGEHRHHVFCRCVIKDKEQAATPEFNSFLLLCSGQEKKLLSCVKMPLGGRWNLEILEQDLRKRTLRLLLSGCVGKY